MTDNPIQRKLGTARTVPTQQELVDYGNNHLMSISRFDIHWFVANGRVCVGSRLDNR